MITEDYLKKFNHNEFYENIKEFGGYIANREKIVRLNPDRLVNLLNVYFRSVLLYPSRDCCKYIFTDPSGRLV